MNYAGISRDGPCEAFDSVMDINVQLLVALSEIISRQAFLLHAKSNC